MRESKGLEYNQVHMLSRKTKLIINIVTIVALLVLIVVSWDQIQAGLREIGGAKWSMIALMIPMQLINYYAVGRLYYDYFAAKGRRVGTKWDMFKVALELNFVNHVFPSGGVAGFSYLGVRMKHFGVPVAQTTLAQAVRFVLTFISFLVLLFAGLFLLSFSDRAGGLVLFLGLSIAFLTLFGTLVAIYIVSDVGRIKAFTAFLPKAVNAVVRPFTKRRNLINVDRIEKLFGDLHDDYMQIARERKILRRPLVWALIINITEVATAYLAYLALGQAVNPGAVILAYSVASFAGLVSILPGGIGVYETLMTATLASAGVSKALALSATLIYRIFCVVVFVPIGFVLYQIALKKGEAEGVRHAKQPTDV